MSSTCYVLKVQSREQHAGLTWELGRNVEVQPLSLPHPDPLEQNLYYNKIPGDLHAH